VPSDIDSQTAELLDQPPDFGTIGFQFIGDFSAAYDDGGVIA
jgi:hypothetical protein